NTRPANIARIEVYAMTSLQTLTDDQIIKQGTRVATIPVKAPKDPNQTIDEDEPAADMEAPEGQGLDQGSVAHASETLTPGAQAPVQPKPDKTLSARKTADATGGPLLPVRAAPVVRAYVLVGVSSRDRKGPPSRRIPVPLVNIPPTPPSPVVAYDEKAIAVTWQPVTPAEGIQRAAREGELPSRP